VCNAIAPADIARVIIDEANGAMELVVPDDKLSLAIGRRGQNVRLASQLTGWKLDVIGESKFKTMEQEAITGLASIEGIDERVALALYKQGFRTVDEVAEAANQEFSGVEALIGAENTASLKRRAEEAVERIRLERIENAVDSPEPLTDRETLQLVRGVTPRIAELIIHAGYKTVQDLSDETDIDRLAIKTGLGIKKARQINEGVVDYMEKHAARIEEGQRLAREKAEQEARERKLLEEAQAEQEKAADGDDGSAGEASDTENEPAATTADTESDQAADSGPTAAGSEPGERVEKGEQGA
jgi:N utilization substance protein A